VSQRLVAPFAGEDNANALGPELGPAAHPAMPEHGNILTATKANAFPPNHLLIHRKPPFLKLDAILFIRFWIQARLSQYILLRVVSFGFLEQDPSDPCLDLKFLNTKM
jgi:hypothetical protein